MPISSTFVVLAIGHVGSLIAIVLKDTSHDYLVVQSPLTAFYSSALLFDVIVRAER